MNVVNDEEIEGLIGLFAKDDFDELEDLVAEYDDEVSTPCFPLSVVSLMESTTNMCDGDALVGIKEVRKSKWVDFVDEKAHKKSLRCF